MHHIKMLLVGMGCILLIIVIIGGLLPSVARVERAGVIQAPVAVVYKALSRFDEWNAWNPWNQRDPQWQTHFSVPQGISGAYFTWKSNDHHVGEGKTILLTAFPDSLVRFRTELKGAPVSEGIIWLIPTPDGKATGIKWRLDTQLGGNPFLHYWGLLMDRMMGKSLEQALTRLKSYCESTARSIGLTSLLTKPWLIF